MKLVLNVNYDYDCFTSEKTAQMAREAGFTGVDIGLFDMKVTDSPWFQPNWVEKAENIKKAFANENVPVVQTHAPFQFPVISDARAYMENIRSNVVHSLEVSAALGAECVIVHPIQCLPYWDNSEELYQVNMDYYRSLIPVCRDLGIKIAVENMFQVDKIRGNRIVHSTCSRPEEFCRYIDTLNSEYIVGCLDIGHIVLPTENTTPWDFIRILGHDRLKTLHIHDNDFKDDRHWVPFSGQIDWYRVTEALGQIDYTGDFVYESIMGRVVNGMAPEAYPLMLQYMAGVGKYLIENIEKNRPSAR